MAAHVRNFPWRFFQRRKVYFDGISKRVFHSFGIKDILLKRLRKISIEKPTAVQEKVSFSYVVGGQCIFGQAVFFSLTVFSQL